jgi:O-antigen ligase
MISTLRINNILVFLLALAVPFIETWSIGGHNIMNFQQISVALIAYYLFLKTCLPGSSPLAAVKSPISITLVVFSVLVCISYLFITDNYSLGVTQVMNYVEVAVVYLIVSELCYNESTIKWLFRGLILGFLVSFFIALMQKAGYTAFNLFQEDDLNLNPNTTYVSKENQVDAVRIWGPFGNALTFSLYLSVVGVVLFYYYRLYKQKQLYAWIIFAMTMLSISWTISRMAFAAFLVSIFVIEMIIANRFQRIRNILIILGLAIVFSLVKTSLSSSNELVSRITDTHDDFKEGRLDLWIIGYRIWMENLFFGAGPGNLNLELYKHGLVGLDPYVMQFIIGHVENFYLTVLFTFGLVPFVCYVLFIISYFRAAIALFFHGLRTDVNKIAMPLLAGFICFFINNLINPVLNTDQRIQMLFVLLLVVANVYYKRMVAEVDIEPDYDGLVVA